MSSDASAPPRVVVVGGGLAGLSAAIACADAGVNVTLLEGRPRLGGATWSFQRNGLSFDNGQHVHLKCCNAYRAFLRRLGTSQLAPFAGPLSIPVLRPPRDGADRPSVAFIKRDFLPAPLHLGRSLSSYSHLSWAERLRLVPAALALRLCDLDDRALDSESFGHFLRRHGQSTAAIEALWDLVTLPTTNLRAEEVSLSLAAKVFKTGLLTRSDASDIAWSKVPLATLHVEPARRLLESLGATVRRKARVTALVTSGDRSLLRGVEVDGEVVEADAVVLAVPHDEAAFLLPPGACEDPLMLHRLGTVPIVNVHFVFGEKVMPYAMAAAVSSPVQFVFDRTDAAGPQATGQVVAISLSGASGEIGERPQQLIETQLAAFRQLFPAARRVEPADAVVTREHEATFEGAPGTRRLRLPAKTAISNLALAGAWTDTGWPATMEGAVRSGQAAANVVLSSFERRSPLSLAREEVSA